MPLPTAKSRAIGARISQVRCDAGLSTTEFAHQLGLWSRTMLQYESGVKRVPRYVIVAIAYLFACNEQWLLTGEGSRQDTHAQQVHHGASQPVQWLAWYGLFVVLLSVLGFMVLQRLFR